jgi:hypothetical protein
LLTGVKEDPRQWTTPDERNLTRWPRQCRM